MKKAFSFLIVLGSILLFFSCYTERALVTGPSQNNDTYRVDYLFEHDGCKVYRFYDMGSYVYFSNCSGDITAIKNDSTKRRTVTITHQE